MSEVNKDTIILITTSWQALNRVGLNNSDSTICDCTIVILFAGFFIESNLNYILDYLELTQDMKKFLDNKPYPGLKDKLAWFYNHFISKTKATNKRQLFTNNHIEQKLKRRYPGFAQLNQFRNDICHGVVNQCATSIHTASQLRKQAKNIVDDLFKVVKARTGHDLPRETTFTQAVNP